MSDFGQGPGWWQASDGKWYPPAPAQAQPDAASAPLVAIPPEPGGGIHTEGYVQVPSAAPAPSPPPSTTERHPDQAGYPTQFPQQPAQQFAGAPGPVPPKRNTAKVVASVGGVMAIALLGVIGYLLTRDDSDEQAIERSTPTTAAVDEPSTTTPATTSPATTAPATTAPPTTVTASTAPPRPAELTSTQRAAAEKAKGFVESSAYSRDRLIELLTYDDEFTVEDATIGIDSLSIDWNEQAERSAASYLEFSNYSYERLFDQLSSPYGAGFTEEQARYGLDNVEVDWNAEAADAAYEVLEDLDEPTCEEVIDELVDSYAFTPEQAQAGAEDAEAC